MLARVEVRQPILDAHQGSGLDDPDDRPVEGRVEFRPASELGLHGRRDDHLPVEVAQQPEATGLLEVAERRGIADDDHNLPRRFRVSESAARSSTV